LRKLLAWHNKPRFHGESIFWHGDVEVARILSSSGRFASFKEFVGYYEKKPTLENYLRLRREFPGVEIKSGLFGTSDLDFALEPELIKNGIDPNIVASANNAYEPDVDKLSLQKPATKRITTSTPMM
jgi:hypothetical protein